MTVHDMSEAFPATRGGRLALLLCLALLPFISVIEANADQRPIAVDSSWERLLHFEHGKSRVTSDPFFLSPRSERTPATELSEFIRILHTPDGPALACAFPARYLHVADRYPDSPRFTLEDCPDLTRFLSGYRSERISLVFVSELVDAPASAFGHLFLLIDHPSQNRLLANVIQFGADTGDDRGFSYVIGGLSGGYPGYYMNDPYFERLFHYTVIEQRELHFFDVDLDENEQRRLLYHLYELRTAAFRYYFTRENCAFQIGYLLEVATDEPYVSSRFKRQAVPLEVVKAFRNRLSPGIAVAPSLSLANTLFQGLSAAGQQRVLAVIGGARPDPAMLSDSEKQVLVSHYEYRFRRHGHVYENYASVTGLRFTPDGSGESYTARLDDNAPARFGLGLMISDDISAVMSYRPLARDRYDVRSAIHDASELVLLDLELRFRSSSMSLESADIFRLSSMPTRSELHQPASWEAYAGFNRFNEQTALRFVTEAGVGRSYRTSSGSFSLLAIPGIQLDSGRTRPYADLATRFHSVIDRNTMIGLALRMNTLGSGSISRAETWISRRLGTRSISFKLAWSDSSRDAHAHLMIHNYL